MKNKTLIYINARFLTQQLTGVQRFAIEIAKRIRYSQDFDICFVSPKGILDAALSQELNVITFGCFSSHLWEQIELPLYLLKKGNPILLSLCNTAPVLYNKNVVVIHDLAFIENPKWFSYAFSKYYRLIIPVIIRKSMHVITVSNFSKNEIIRTYKVNSKKISIIYNGIEHIRETHDGSINDLKQSYFLMVGSLDPRKNIQYVIDAFSSKELQKFQLKIVGGSSKIFSQKIKHKSDNIEFLGRVSDTILADLYKKAKGFIYISLYEGFGIPPIESLCFDTLPIVSDIEVFREVLGDNVIYVNPHQTSDLIDKVTKLSLSDFDYKKKVSLSKKHISKYSWNASNTQILSLLKNLT